MFGLQGEVQTECFVEILDVILRQTDTQFQAWMLPGVAHK
jgi:hypothetical protein